jgi:hypothetical protein
MKKLCRNPPVSLIFSPDDPPGRHIPRPPRRLSADLRQILNFACLCRPILLSLAEGNYFHPYGKLPPPTIARS